MNFTAAMRVGSLEILAAIAAFGFVTARLRLAPARPRPTALTLLLVLREGATAAIPREVSLDVSEGTPIVIGRSAHAGLEVADPEVSRQHARLELVRGVLYLADLHSSNGTFLNGKVLSDESIEVRPGDDIDVGNTRITIREAASAS